MNKLKDKIKEMSKDTKGKAVLFFGFYIIFFAGVFLFINLTDSKLTYGDDYERSTVSYTFNLDNIFKENYSFTYDITLDNNFYSYFGAKKEEVESFKYNNLDYYRDGEKFLVKKDEWIEAENPYVYREYLNNKNIKMILENAYFVSKTVYESGKNTFNFAISSNTLNNLLYGLNTDFDEVPNEIIISTDENKNVNNIIFNLNSLCKNNDFCNYGFKVDLKFDNFGDIEGILDPQAE